VSGPQQTTAQPTGDRMARSQHAYSTATMPTPPHHCPACRRRHDALRAHHGRQGHRPGDV